MVTDKLASLQRQLGGADRAKLDEFLEAVRDVERGLGHAERQQQSGKLPHIKEPVGVPDSFEEHVKLMFDLQVLAFQTDLTRVGTFMMGREYSGLTYPQVGVTEAHHPLSHHQGNPEKLAKLTKVSAYHATLFSYYLSKLSAVTEGDGTLLDQVTVLYGAGLSDSDQHLSNNIPVLLAGGSAPSPGGRHVRYPDTTPMANLHLTLLQELDVPVEQFANSTGRLSDLFVV